MKAFENEAEKGLYSDFARMLGEVYPDVLKSATSDEPSDYKEGLNQGLAVAFIYFKSYTNNAISSKPPKPKTNG